MERATRSLRSRLGSSGYQTTLLFRLPFFCGIIWRTVIIVASLLTVWKGSAMKCKLCLKERELKDSHIIPEFIYECSGLYDGKQRFTIVKRTDEGMGELELRQKGLKEKLLCGDCENRISKWEGYARWVIYSPGKSEQVKSVRTRVVLYENVEYDKFKLFQMSLLWRMSVSKLKQFSEVRLGRRHQETMRRMILDEDSGAEDDYGCFMTVIIFDPNDLASNEQLRRFWLSPRRVRTRDGHISYTMFIGGFYYVFVVSKHHIPREIRQLFLDRTNQLPILAATPDEVPDVKGNLLKSLLHLRRSAGSHEFRFPS